MSLLQRQFLTSWLLLVAFSGALFVLLGFVDFFPYGDKLNYWAWWCQLLTRDYPPTAAFIAIIAAGGLRAVPAVVVGWALQGLAVVAWTFLRKGIRSSEPTQSPL
jgi:hypothetical protein